MATREELETALDKGKLYMRMQSGNYWRARRNGKTQVWKSDPTRFSIPFKVGLKVCGRLDNTWLTDDAKAYYEIRD